MLVDEWLNGKVETVSPNVVNRALGELGGEADKLENLVKQGKHWDAYNRLISTVSFINIASQQQPSKVPEIIQRLLDWIHKIKDSVAKIIKGIGGNGYSISVSVPSGISVVV